jgi:glutamate-1-semialdehyde 2,1-aminomutase
MPLQGPKSHEFFERAMKVIPYGVNSNFRYYDEYNSVVVADARDGYVFDFDGNQYIDYRLGFGPIILGHADPFVNGRVKEAIDHGISFAATQEYEVKVAERIIQMVPGIDKVRLTNTGSECTMHALRLARGFTGRDLVVKFEGSYHGAHDYTLWSTAGGDINKVGNRQRPTAHKMSWGIPEMMRDLIQVMPFNDVEILGDFLQEKGEQVAAIIVEPILGNGNAIMPRPGFLQFLRDQCTQYGIVLIFDEVKTGFRISAGGARETFGVMPDISTYAKALGNGYPIAAIGGRDDIMMHMAPGKVFQGGTYTGNVVSTAAADATLEFMQSGKVFPQIEKVGTILMEGFSEICTRHSVPHLINGVPAMFGVTFNHDEPMYEWRDLFKADWDFYEVVARRMMELGVMPEADGMEPFFLCSDHTEEDAAKTLEAFEEGVKTALGK